MQKGKGSVESQLTTVILIIAFMRSLDPRSWILAVAALGVAARERSQVRSTVHLRIPVSDRIRSAESGHGKRRPRFQVPETGAPIKARWPIGNDLGGSSTVQAVAWKWQTLKWSSRPAA
jgi:hypothetical protein